MTRAQFFSQNAGHMMYPCFGDRIRIGAIAHRHFAHHAANIDHPRRIVHRARIRQHIAQTLGQVEHASHVQGHHLFPSVIGENAKWHAPSAPCVVHQDVQCTGALLHCADQGLNTLGAADIAAKALGRAGKIGSVYSGGNLGAGFCLAACNENTRAGSGQSCGGHPPNTGGPASD